MKIAHCKNSVGLFVVALSLSAGVVAQEPMRAIIPAQTGAHANRVNSPGVEAGDYVYVSGQGPRKPDGNLPAGFSDRVKQALDNVHAVVTSAGLTIENVVYVQVYLEDMATTTT